MKSRQTGGAAKFLVLYRPLPENSPDFFSFLGVSDPVTATTATCVDSTPNVQEAPTSSMNDFCAETQVHRGKRERLSLQPDPKTSNRDKRSMSKYSIRNSVPMELSVLQGGEKLNRIYVYFLQPEELISRDGQGTKMLPQRSKRYL